MIFVVYGSYTGITSRQSRLIFGGRGGWGGGYVLYSRRGKKEGKEGKKKEKKRETDDVRMFLSFVCFGLPMHILYSWNLYFFFCFGFGDQDIQVMTYGTFFCSENWLRHFCGFVIFVMVTVVVTVGGG